MPGLLIGAAPSPRTCRTLARAGVVTVVDLRAEAAAPDPWPHGVRVLRMPVDDGCGPSLDQLDAIVLRVVDELAADNVVLVHCRAGYQRTATVAIAVLLHMGYELPQACRIVRERRPGSAPTSLQMTVLQGYAAARRTQPASDRCVQAPASAEARLVNGDRLSSHAVG